MEGPPPGATLLLYDGVCGLCDRLVRFIASRDSRGRIRFAALQAPLARAVLAANHLKPDDLDTVYVVADWATPRQRLLSRSRAVLQALVEVGGVWRWLARVALLIPPFAADAVYARIARSRYRIFGRYDACPVPPQAWRERFLDRQGDGD
jgi:predicted DCC family thiol-disulfide oxidoreductase YuxK